MLSKNRRLLCSTDLPSTGITKSRAISLFLLFVFERELWNWMVEIGGMYGVQSGGSRGGSRIKNIGRVKQRANHRVGGRARVSSINHPSTHTCQTTPSSCQEVPGSLSPWEHLSSRRSGLGPPSSRQIKVCIHQYLYIQLKFTRHFLLCHHATGNPHIMQASPWKACIFDHNAKSAICLLCSSLDIETPRLSS
jgi:hypothetical protein